MCTMDEMRLSAILLPVWIMFLFVAFKMLRRKVPLRSTTMSDLIL
ncbi:hypothetical protein ACNKHK_02960 [Shigella flexneri]